MNLLKEKDCTELTKEELNEIQRKLSRARSEILIQYPFYGHLLLLMPITLGKCGTACTDMTRITFDPKFVLRIPTNEVVFVMLHEIMHCVLQHCVRGTGKISYFYNIAADIVINSNIMANMGVKEFHVDGKYVMHKYDDDIEGLTIGTEALYEKLIRKYESLINNVKKAVEQVEKDYGVAIDNHAIWRTVSLNPSATDTWKQRLKEAAKSVKEGAEGKVPSAIKRYLDDIEYEGLINWREILYSFMQVSLMDEDYSFTPSDRRFSMGEFIMPAFAQSCEEILKDIWFAVDISYSVGDKVVSLVFKELEAIISQFDNVNAKYSAFGESVTEPVPFSEVKDFDRVQLYCIGGTSFHCIFEYMKKKMSDNLPKVLVILTDGLAEWPKEEMSLQVPVLWIIIDNDDIEAPWGTTIHIRTAEEEFLQINEDGLFD